MKTEVQEGRFVLSFTKEEFKILMDQIGSLPAGQFKTAYMIQNVYNHGYSLLRHHMPDRWVEENT